MSPDAPSATVPAVRAPEERFAGLPDFPFRWPRDHISIRAQDPDRVRLKTHFENVEVPRNE